MSRAQIVRVPLSLPGRCGRCPSRRV